MSSSSRSSSRQSTKPQGRSSSPYPVPDFLKVEPDFIDIHFKLRDCQFMEYNDKIDKTTGTVYDLMWSVSKHHGNTITTDSVRIYQKISDDNYKLLTDITQKISDLGDVDTFYYDYDPVEGSLLIIPTSEKPS